MWTKTPMKEESTVIFVNTKDSETLLPFINVHMAYQEIIPAWKCVSGTISKFSKGKLKYLVKNTDARRQVKSWLKLFQKKAN